MKSTRRSLRNHHDGHHEPGDPLGVYMPPLSEWGKQYTRGSYDLVWRHPNIQTWLFWIHKGRTVTCRVRDLSLPLRAKSLFTGHARTVEGAYESLRRWYAAQTHASLARLSERNPDWSDVRAKASHYADRAAAGARSAYDWTAPRARAAGHAAWEGTKAAGRAVKRGAKRAAPVIARGAKSAAERMDRWAAEPNGGVRGAKRLGSYILRYSSTLGSPESTVGMAFYQGRSIARSIAQEALRDLKWQLDFDTHWAGRPWRRGEKKHLASTINSLEAAIKRAG